MKEIKENRKQELFSLEADGYLEDHLHLLEKAELEEKIQLLRNMKDKIEKNKEFINELKEFNIDQFAE